MNNVKFREPLKGLSMFSNVGLAETYLAELGIDIVVANELLEERAKFYKHLYPNTNMIVGDITDENDVPTESNLQVVKTDAGGFRLDGQTTLRDINRHFKWELSDDKASTLAGYILYEVERIPSVGETFVIDGFSFTVVSKNRNRLAVIEILPPAS